MRSKKGLDYSDTGFFFFFWLSFVLCSVQFTSVQLLFATPWTAAHQASLSINSRSLLRLMSIESLIHPTVSSSAVLFSSCLQSFPASGSFLVSQFFAPVMLCSLIYSKFINSFTLKPTITLGITWLWQSMQHVRLKALLHCTHSCDHSLDFVSWSSTTSESYTPVYHCCPGMADIQRGRGLFLCLHVRRQTDQMNLVWFFLRFRELTAILWLR